jgi:hypothetical protein
MPRIDVVSSLSHLGQVGSGIGPQWCVGCTQLGNRCNPEQPVVEPRRCTETGEAPRWQGATTANTGSI